MKHAKHRKATSKRPPQIDEAALKTGPTLNVGPGTDAGMRGFMQDMGENLNYGQKARPARPANKAKRRK